MISKNNTVSSKPSNSNVKVGRARERNINTRATSVALTGSNPSGPSLDSVPTNQSEAFASRPESQTSGAASGARPKSSAANSPVRAPVASQKESFASGTRPKSSAAQVVDKVHVCGVCLRLCATMLHKQHESIDSAKRFASAHGIEAARAKYSVEMCLKCQTGVHVVDSVCGECGNTDLFGISAIGHEHFHNGTLYFRNNATGTLFYPEKDPESWHLVSQPSRPNATLKAKFDALFALIRGGKTHPLCVLVNSDQVISRMVEHIPVADYLRVTPGFCPSHIAAKAAWSLLRIRLAPLDVSIWYDAFMFHLDRERIRAEMQARVAAGQAAFGSMSRRIYEGVDIGSYLVELVNSLIRNCLASQSRNPTGLRRLCDGIIPELTVRMVEHAEEYDIEGLSAMSSFEDICEAVVSSSLLSCSMFHVIKRIWHQLVRHIHPDKGGLASDFANCDNIFVQLKKFLDSENEQELENYRRSVAVVRKATTQIHQLLEDIKSAPSGYLQAAKCGMKESGSGSGSESRELVLFEEVCGALVEYGTIDQSLVSSLKSLHEVIPGEVEELVRSCVPIASCGVGVSSTLSMVAIATGNTIDLAPSAQTEVAASYAMEQAPKIFTEIEYPELGSTASDVALALSNLNSEEIAIYDEYLTIQVAEKACEVLEEMAVEESRLEIVSEDFEEAMELTYDTNGKKQCKEIVRSKIAATIRDMRGIIYFRPSVSRADRAAMLQYVLGVEDLPVECFITEMEAEYFSKSAGTVYQMRDTLMTMIGAEARENQRREANLIKSIAGQEAKRLRDEAEAKAEAEAKRLREAAEAEAIRLREAAHAEANRLDADADVVEAEANRLHEAANTLEAVEVADVGEAAALKARSERLREAAKAAESEVVRLRDAAKLVLAALMSSTSKSKVHVQEDFTASHDAHRAALAAQAKAHKLALSKLGLAWIRDLKRDDDSGKFVITDMVSGLVSEVPEDLLITVFTSAKEKDCGKLTGNHKQTQVSASALLRKMQDRPIPDEFYLRPLVLHYKSGAKNDMILDQIDAGTSQFAKKNIGELRNKLEARISKKHKSDKSDKSDESEESDESDESEESDAKKTKKPDTSKIDEANIDEIDASFELGKGVFVANFCATRASSSALSRERAERRKEQLAKKTTTVIRVQVATEVQVEDETTGELKDDIVMKTVEEVVVIVPTGANNFYKLVVNPNHGTKSSGRVSLGGR